MKNYNWVQVTFMGLIGFLPTVSWIILTVFLVILGWFGSPQGSGTIVFGLAGLAIACAIVRWQYIVTVGDYKSPPVSPLGFNRVLLRKGSDGKVEAGTIFWRRRGDQFSSIYLPELDKDGFFLVPFAFEKQDLPEGVTVKGEIRIKLAKPAYEDKELVEAFYPFELWRFTGNAFSAQMGLSHQFTEAARNDSGVMAVLDRDYKDLDGYATMVHSMLQKAMWPVMPKTMATADIYVSVTRGRKEIKIH